MEKKYDKAGQPTKYREEYSEQAYKLCLLGATDKDIADFFVVSESTINNWKIKHPEFLESLQKGKMIADSEVAQSLYHSAKGFETTEVIHTSFQGSITDIKEVRKFHPPNPTSAIFWLKNRQPKYWRDKQEIDHTSGGDKMQETKIIFT